MRPSRDSVAFMATKAEIRSAILEAMNDADAPNQVVGLEHAVRRILGVRAGERSPPPDTVLDPEAKRLFFEVVWNFIGTGILVPYYNRSNTKWPFLSLTTEGRELAERGEPSPADPDGFLRHVEDAFSSGLPDTVSLYLREAVFAFNRRLYIAASVMLGVAAEGLLLEVASAVRDSHLDASVGRDWYAGSIESTPALRQYRSIASKLEPVQRDMPHELRERFDANFRSIRNLIREQRNEDGHPTGNTRDRDDLLPALYLFAPYARLTAELIGWLSDTARL